MRYFESLRPRWLYLAWLFFMILLFLDRDEVEAIKSFKNRARQISSYLDWQAWTIKDMAKRIFSCGTKSGGQNSTILSGCGVSHII